MPGNLIVINGDKGLTWYVGDSKMDELIKFLHKIGIQQEPIKFEASDHYPIKPTASVVVN